MFELWMILLIVSIFGCLVFALIRDALRDRKRFYQHDWVAAHKRTLSRNAFKSRVGRPYREYK